MSGWPTASLSRLAADEPSSISKPYGSAIYKDDYTTQGIPVVRGVNLARGVFHDDDFVFISPALAAKMPGAQLKAGDLVFTHRGTVGQVSMVPRSPRHERYVASTSQVKVRLDAKNAVPEFYYYWFTSEMGQQSILENISTVGVPGLVQPVATIKRLAVPVPPLREQQAIAEVLGALDDKIAANTQLAAAAEALAEAAFQHWLVTTETRESALAEVATVVLGGTPDRSRLDFWTDGTVAWLNSGKVNENRILEPSELITQQALDASAAKLMPRGATLIAITGATLGQIARLEIEASGNQSIVGIWSGSAAMNAWLHFAIKYKLPDLLSRATGAAQQHVNKKDVEFLGIPMLEGNVETFGNEVVPLLDVARAADLENLWLASTRDVLLPQLMSGKLRVKDAEALVAETV
ncbi:restriction endonuclease subunit S [Sinomonas flava]|uniref:restriction endonuclease subunit S n=1 Tax=Sinomonas flava TaxID=496857 RepID=UPI0039A4D8CB